MQLDARRRARCDRASTSAGRSASTARGGGLPILDLATEQMVSAIEEITVNQGIDPAEAVLVGGGGAAGLNSVAIARRLGCRRGARPGRSAPRSSAAGRADVRRLRASFRRSASARAAALRLRRRQRRRSRDLRGRAEAFIEGPGRGRRRDGDRLLGRGALPAPGLGDRGAARAVRCSTARRRSTRSSRTSTRVHQRRLRRRRPSVADRDR